MPGFDRTGPEGKGSMTGRGQGKCNPHKEIERNSNVDDVESGRGLGRRFRFRRGSGNGSGQGRGRGSL